METSTYQFLVARAWNRLPYCDVHVYCIARNFQERELSQSSEKYDSVEKTFRNCLLVLAKDANFTEKTFANSHMQNLEICESFLSFPLYNTICAIVCVYGERVNRVSYGILSWEGINMVVAG